MCAKCVTPIQNKWVEAVGAAWHPGCFTCSVCNEEMQPGKFKVKGDKEPVCQKCSERIAFTCAGCNLVINGLGISLQGVHWHPECLQCSFCGTTLHSSKVYQKQKQPCCGACIQSQQVFKSTAPAESLSTEGEDIVECTLPDPTLSLANLLANPEARTFFKQYLEVAFYIWFSENIDRGYFALKICSSGKT